MPAPHNTHVHDILKLYDFPASVFFIFLLSSLILKPPLSEPARFETQQSLKNKMGETTHDNTRISPKSKQLSLSPL
jgi:hypothetical protein